MRLFLKLFAGVIVLVVALVGGFLFAIEHPTTRGPVRCWLQETLYTQSWETPPAGTPIIEARLTTEPVRDLCDAADDPAIWVSDLIEGGVVVLGTNKQSSLNVYDIQGALIDRAGDIGAPNNVDIRVDNGRVIAMASDKDDSEIEVFELDLEAGKLIRLDAVEISADVEDEVYGLCMYASDREVFVFITDKSGLISQYLVNSELGRARKVRELRVGTQPEGCVVDDAVHALYVGEEDVGIWRFSAKPDAGTDGHLIARTGDAGTLTADVEGLSIYGGEALEEGYLVASSQGDNTYAVYDRAPPHDFRGRFQLSFGGAIIGDTDGLAVTSKPIGEAFPSGLLVVQDGFIRDENGKRRNQRFAYVSWSDIEAALGL